MRICRSELELLRKIRRSFDCRYGTVISLGQNCSTATYMKRNGLRTFSAPFDWLDAGKANLEAYIDLIENDFAGFLSRDSLVRRTEGELADGKHMYYDDIKLGVGVLHDFPINLSFDDAYLRVMVKYNRRIKRVYALASKSKHVLFVYSAITERLSRENIVAYAERLRAKFANRNVDLAVFQHVEGVGGLKEVEVLGRGIVLVEGYFHPASTTYWGNKLLNDAVFWCIPKDLKLTMKHVQRQLIECAIRTASCFIFFDRNKRKAFRKKHLDMI